MNCPYNDFLRALHLELVAKPSFCGLFTSSSSLSKKKEENMESYPFELGPIRPVDEGDSLLIRTTRGCPWNKCEFCVNYKDMRFSIRPVEEIKRDILAACARYYGGHPFQSCFLQDGDSFIMKTGDLLEILRLLREHFPTLKRVTSYGRAQTMIRKSPAEMKEVCQAGLTLLYCGMESGSDTVLKKIRKGITPQDRRGVHYTEMQFQHLDPVKGKLPLFRLVRELGKFFRALYPLFRQTVAS